MPSIVILGILIVSPLVTYLVLRIAPKIGLVCIPSDRSSHSGIMPHGGGIGFVTTFLLAISILYYQEYLPGNQWLVLVGCGGLIALLGLWDDITHVAIHWRLLVQFICVSLGVWLLGGLAALQAGNQVVYIGLIGFGISVLLLMWWLNLFNFMDGIDGLAASEAIYIALGAVTVLWFGDWISVPDIPSDTAVFELLLVIFSASVFGFLLFNWPPASIFMGDVGSTFLGYTLGMLALISVIEGILSIWVWLILSGVFWVDATLTLVRRMLTGERWYEAHKSHAYQHAVEMFHNLDKFATSSLLKANRNHPHRRASSIIIIINLFWLLPMACISVVLPNMAIMILVMAWAPLIWLAYRLGAGKHRSAE
jgi:Fuc2NAc and GlcNAc transferase